MYLDTEKYKEPAAAPEQDKVLLDAADIIERRGWHRGSYESGYGAVCALGAINIAANGAALKFGPSSNDAVVRMTHYLVQTGYEDGVHSWNDQPGRTKEEVVAALRAAAASPHLTSIICTT